MPLFSTWRKPEYITFIGALSGLTQFLAAESPLEMTKNTFGFTSKALFVLKIFKSLSWLFGHLAKRRDKKDKVIFKFYDVTVWLTTNCNIHILPNISRSKGNQIMKFGQLIEFNMRNIFLGISYKKCVEELVQDPFLKN